MRRKLFTTLVLVLLCLSSLAAAVNSGSAPRAKFESPQLASADEIQPLQNPPTLNEPRPTDCAVQPPLMRSGAAVKRYVGQSENPLSLLRFRQMQFTQLAEQDTLPGQQRPAPAYSPREEIVLIDPTNFGDRYFKDIYGKPAMLEPIVVLHETVASANSTLNFFRTPHPNDDDQASYHTLIKRDGTIIYMVPPDKRAYGAGNSVFNGKRGPEAVKTHPNFPASVNNFAYHISLESPSDGFNNAYRHSGYTEAQYQSLAWLVAKTGVPDDRITTHKAVDRSGDRMDPRSFSFATFFKLLQTYTKTDDIAIRCTPPPDVMQTGQARPSKPSPKPQVAKRTAEVPSAQRQN